MWGRSNSTMCDVSSISRSVAIKFIPNMFFSIAIVDASILVIINVVKPVATMLVRPVCYVGADPGLADIICVEERAK
jgi:hypothetical protein